MMEDAEQGTIPDEEDTWSKNWNSGSSTHGNDEEFGLYERRPSSGFVGLKNQGATCYLNSLIQVLYATFMDPFFDFVETKLLLGLNKIK